MFKKQHFYTDWKALFYDYIFYPNVLGVWRWRDFELLHSPVIKYTFVSSSVCLLASDMLKKKVTITKYHDCTVGHVMY
jgi:hypothetical protein